MPTYKNIKTLAVITTASEVCGENWVKVEEETQPSPEPKKPRNTKKKVVENNE